VKGSRTEKTGRLLVHPDPPTAGAIMAPAHARAMIFVCLLASLAALSSAPGALANQV